MPLPCRPGNPGMPTHFRAILRMRVRVSSSQEGGPGAATKVAKLFVVRGLSRVPLPPPLPPPSVGEVERLSFGEAAAGRLGRESPDPGLGNSSSGPGREDDGGVGETASCGSSLALG